MKLLTGCFATVIFALLFASAARALTLDEIIRLKQVGVSDSTIELLIKRAGDARSAGVWKQDGWIVYSTETRFPDNPRFENYLSDYPIALSPEIYTGGRHKMTRSHQQGKKPTDRELKKMEQGHKNASGED